MLNGHYYGSMDSLSVNRESLRSVSKESLVSAGREEAADLDGLIWDRWRHEVSVCL